MRLVSCLLISTGMLLATSCKDSSSLKSSKLEVSFKKEGTLTLLKGKTDSLLKTLDVEFAESEYETQTGLMYRNQMEDHQGMLFLFSDSQPRAFYMKNTRIPLDIIYLDADKKIVNISKNAKPFDETSLPSKEAAMYVLEINAGLSEEWNLEFGDYIEFKKLK